MAGARRCATAAGDQGTAFFQKKWLDTQGSDGLEGSLLNHPKAYECCVSEVFHSATIHRIHLVVAGHMGKPASYKPPLLVHNCA